jgi:hypothetical protein
LAHEIFFPIGGNNRLAKSAAIVRRGLSIFACPPGRRQLQRRCTGATIAPARPFGAGFV